MKKFLIGISALVLLLLLAVALIPQFIDFNRYKGHFEAQLSKHLGAKAELRGDIRFHWLPLGFDFTQLHLGAPQNALWQGAEVRQITLAFDPQSVFALQPKLSALIIQGLALELSALPSQDALWRWIPVAAPAIAAEPRQGFLPYPLDIAIQDFSVSAGSKNPQAWWISQGQLLWKGFAPDQWQDMQMQGQWQLADEKVPFNLKAQAKWQGQSLSLNQLSVTGEWLTPRGQSWPWQLTADNWQMAKAKSQWQMTNAHLKIAQYQAQWTGRGQENQGEAQLHLPRMPLDPWFKRLGVERLNFAEPSALREAALSLRLDWQPGQLSIENLDMTLDKMQLQGSARYHDDKGWLGELHLNRFLWQDYLVHGEEGLRFPLAVPVSFLRNTRMVFDLSIDQIQLNLSGVDLPWQLTLPRLSIYQGQMQLTDVQAKSSQALLRIPQFQVDVRGDTPEYAGEVLWQDVPFALGQPELAWLSGQTSGAWQGKTLGSNGEALAANAQGDLSLNIAPISTSLPLQTQPQGRLSLQGPISQGFWEIPQGTYQDPTQVLQLSGYVNLVRQSLALKLSQGQQQAWLKGRLQQPRLEIQP